MRRAIPTLVGLLVMSVVLSGSPAGANGRRLPAGPVCQQSGPFVAQVIRILFGPRPFVPVWPGDRSTICDKAQKFSLREVEPGIVVGRPSSATVVVIADRSLVEVGAIDGVRQHASSVSGDVVVNANWFTAGGTQAPLVADGRLSGSADWNGRGQFLVLRPDCSGGPRPGFEHLWTGFIYEHSDCVTTAVSGISIVHMGQRADAFPGVDITNGYTMINRAHSFVGFNDSEIIIVSTREMTAPQLADYGLALGALEGVMLDGGGSTQIKTTTESLTSERTVPSFLVINSRNR